MDNTSIENKPIQTTPKALVMFFIGVISVILSQVGQTYSIKNDVKDSRNETREVRIMVETLQKDGSTRDTEIKTIQLQIQTIQLQIARIEEQLSNRK